MLPEVEAVVLPAACGKGRIDIGRNVARRGVIPIDGRDAQLVVALAHVEDSVDGPGHHTLLPDVVEGVVAVGVVRRRG